MVFPKAFKRIGPDTLSGNFLHADTLSRSRYAIITLRYA